MKMKPVPYAANGVYDNDNNLIGYIMRWNPHGFGECIVQYLDGSASSMYFSELNLADRDKARTYLDLLEP